MSIGRQCEAFTGLPATDAVHRVGDIGGLRRADRAGIDDLPGLRIDHQRLRHAADAEAFADQLRVVDQHGHVEAEHAISAEIVSRVIGRVEFSRKSWRPSFRRSWPAGSGSLSAVAFISFAPFAWLMITIAGRVLVVAQQVRL